MGIFPSLLAAYSGSSAGLGSLLPTPGEAVRAGESGGKACRRSHATPASAWKPPELPFDWELLAVVPCGRTQRERVQPAVIGGKIRRNTALADKPAVQKVPRR